ncbi:MAG TPA: hypothetical protein VKG23_13925 [Thermoanaerobaculia bacterium]|nr:hypothetical protein [Thermoanaerobaculia bacterium]
MRRRVTVAALALCASLAVVSCARRGGSRAAASATPAPAAQTATTPAPAHAVDGGYDLRPEERAAVDDFLRAHSDLRVATDSDHRRSDDDGIDGLYGVYHPYFVRGDANDDGILDFVIAFVRRDSDRDTPWFSVVLFAGKPNGGFEPGGFLEREISLADGDLSLDRDAIVVTPDVSEDLTRRYRWDPSKHRHVFVRDDDEETPSTPSSQI